MSDYVYIFGPEVFSIDDAGWISDFDYGIEVKIGHCSDPKSNLFGLRRARPDFFYWTVKYVPDLGKELESTLHAFWAPFRTSGEFFYLPVNEACWFGDIPQSGLQSNRFGMLHFLLTEYERNFGKEAPLFQRWQMNWKINERRAAHI